MAVICFLNSLSPESARDQAGTHHKLEQPSWTILVTIENGVLPMPSLANYKHRSHYGTKILPPMPEDSFTVQIHHPYNPMNLLWYKLNENRAPSIAGREIKSFRNGADAFCKLSHLQIKAVS